MSKIGPLLLIVGNSGSGKDSVIKRVLELYPPSKPPLISPKRFITRPPSPDTEPFISITKEKFEAMLANGLFFLHWQIYGLSYGIPQDIDTDLEEGHPVIVNVSRKIIQEARKKYAQVHVILIDVPYEILLERLEKRNREPIRAISERLIRAKSKPQVSGIDLIVDNSGELDQAAQAVLHYILSQIEK